MEDYGLPFFILLTLIDLKLNICYNLIVKKGGIIMINKTEHGNIFNSTAKHIVFSINAEGTVGAGFDGQVIEKGWPELLNCGPQKIGTVLSKEIDGITYHALVTHSLKEGWGSAEEQRENTKTCFDNIPVPEGEEIASIAIGTGFIGALSGANPKQIICGMCDSKKNITLYGFSMEEIKQVYDEENIKRLRQSKDSKQFLETLKTYETLEEFYKDLSKIEKVDYTSPETSMESAIEHSRQVLTTLLRAQNLDLTKEQQNVSEALKIIGCVPYSQAHKKFQDKSTIGQLLEKENIAFPLSVYQQLIDSEPKTFSLILGRVLEGGAKYSLISEWLQTQHIAEQLKANQKQ